MTPYTFRHSDSWRGVVCNTKGTTSTRCTLNFCGLFIRLTKLTAEKLGVRAGSHLAFTIDEDKPECIYVRQADDADDTKDIQFTVQYDKKKCGTLKCCSTLVVKHVLQYANAKKSCTCYIASAPTIINGKNHYQVLVANPYRIN